MPEKNEIYVLHNGTNLQIKTDKYPYFSNFELATSNPFCHFVNLL